MKKVLLGASLAVLLTGAGCMGSSQPSGGGGIYGTTDGGRSWASMNVLPLASGVSTIASADITSLTQDPSNENVIYAGTQSSGLLMTFDAGKTWQRPPEEADFEAVRTGAILNVQVDEKHPCTWFILKSNALLKTDTCGRAYASIYQEGRSAETLTAMALDWFNPSIVWLGTTAGDVYKSADGGATWSTATKLKDDVSAFLVSRTDSRVVLAATPRRSLVRTADGGATWKEEEADFKSYQKGGYVSGFSQTHDGKTILMNTEYGIFSSTDAGATWKPLTLVTAHGEVKITGMAVAPGNANVIVYGTSSTFYRSTNGGQAWTTSDLPTTRAASVMLFPGTSETSIMLGVKTVKK